jgi:hypothetical protein
VIDPDEFYTIYGDGSEQRYDAATQHKLYVKLERPQFYAMFGDFDTGLTQTELAALQPLALRLQVGVRRRAGSRTRRSRPTRRSASSRDEIQGDGTSGLYRLSGSTS